MIGWIYVRDESSVWDELGQMKISVVWQFVCIQIQEITNYHGSSSWETNYHGHFVQTDDLSLFLYLYRDELSDELSEFAKLAQGRRSVRNIYTRQMIHLDEWSDWTEELSVV